MDIADAFNIVRVDATMVYFATLSVIFALEVDSYTAMLRGALTCLTYCEIPSKLLDSPLCENRRFAVEHPRLRSCVYKKTCHTDLMCRGVEAAHERFRLPDSGCSSAGERMFEVLGLVSLALIFCLTLVAIVVLGKSDQDVARRALKVLDNFRQSLF